MAQKPCNYNRDFNGFFILAEGLRVVLLGSSATSGRIFFWGGRTLVGWTSGI
jgi:hypothetical protein